jgi:hypothetical protein
VAAGAAADFSGVGAWLAHAAIIRARTETSKVRITDSPVD